MEQLIRRVPFLDQQLLSNPLLRVLNMEDGAIRTLEYFDQDERTKSIFSSSPSQVQTRAQLIEKFEEVAGSLKKNLRKLVCLLYTVLSTAEYCILRKRFP